MSDSPQCCGKSGGEPGFRPCPTGLAWEQELRRQYLSVFRMGKWKACFGVAWLLDSLRVPQSVGSTHKRLEPAQAGEAAAWFAGLSPGSSALRLLLLALPRVFGRALERLSSYCCGASGADSNSRRGCASRVTFTMPSPNRFMLFSVSLRLKSFYIFLKKATTKPVVTPGAACRVRTGTLRCCQQLESGDVGYVGAKAV